VKDSLEGLHGPWFDRAVKEVDSILPEFTRPMPLASIRSLMILSFVRGATYARSESHSGEGK
jgi:hypothetical protein